jgi:hypothetical protein
VLRGIYNYNSFKPLSLPLGVKAKVNKLNSSRIDWLNIVANKEYRLTIIMRRLLVDMLLLAAPIVL